MNELLMDTDWARQVAGQIGGGCWEMAQALRLLFNTCAANSEHWHSPAAREFLGELDRTLRQLNRCAEQGMDLSTQLRREVVAWEQTAHVFDPSGFPKNRYGTFF